ncbi:putative reverse transcriptase domain-containing protein [Tanacetum coccineum]
MIDQALFAKLHQWRWKPSLHRGLTDRRAIARLVFMLTYEVSTLDFKGMKAWSVVTRWIEKMESVFNISSCVLRYQPRPTIWGHAKGSLIGDLCPNAPSDIFTTMARVPNSATSVTKLGTLLVIAGILCGAPGHFKRDCPKLKNKDEGNGNAQGWVYAVGNAEKRGNASGNPDANIIMAKSNGQRSARFTLAQISAKKEEDKSKEKQIKDVPIVRNFPEVFPEDLPGLPPARHKERDKRLPADEKEHEEHLSNIGHCFMKELLYAKFSKMPMFWIPKEFKFRLGKKEENAFQLIKQKLCSAPILALPEGSEDFVVYYDASHKGLGVVLMQREKVIADITTYVSKCIGHVSRSRTNIKGHGDAKYNQKYQVEWDNYHDGFYHQIPRSSQGFRHHLEVIVGLTSKFCSLPTNKGEGSIRQIGKDSLQIFRDHFRKLLGTDISMRMQSSSETDGKSERSIQSRGHAEVREAQLTGPELIQETTEKIVLIKQRMQAVRSTIVATSISGSEVVRWSSRLGTEFAKGLTCKGVVRFGKRRQS